MDLIHLVCLLMLQLTAAYVLPPTNVTLHCHNMKNTLKWTYKQLSPGLRFRVDIGSTLRTRSPLWVDPPTLQADLSFLSNPCDDYHLTVTAVEGQNMSEPSPPDGIIFSYFQNSQAYQKCSLDMPPVNVTAESDDKIVLRFNHPWLLYKQNFYTNSKPKGKRKRHDVQILEDLPVFKYDVDIINQAQDSSHAHQCVKSLCEDTLSVDAAQEKHCVKIKGELEKMRVQGTQEYCALPFKAPVGKNLGNILLYIGVSLLTLVGLALILFMVYQKKTESSTPLPPSMTITKQMREWTLGNVPEQVIVPDVEPTSPSPLLPEKEVNESTPADTPLTEYDLRMPIGVSIKKECEEQKDEYIEGTNLDEDEFTSFEPHSSYEKRQIVVKLAPGEHAEGYRG